MHTSTNAAHREVLSRQGDDKDDEAQKGRAPPRRRRAGRTTVGRRAVVASLTIDDLCSVAAGMQTTRECLISHRPVSSTARAAPPLGHRRHER